MRKIWNLRGKGISIRNISISVKRAKDDLENDIKQGIGGSLKKRIGSKAKLSPKGIGDSACFKQERFILNCDKCFE